MFENILTFMYWFVFIFCWLNIIKNLYGFIKVVKTHEGKLDNGKYGTVLFGLSLSYVITFMVMGCSQ